MFRADWCTFGGVLCLNWLDVHVCDCRYLGNQLVDSDGIHISDNSGENTQPECQAYFGPFVRWTVVRRNMMAGLSLASKNATLPGQRPQCAGVSNRSPGGRWNSTDLVAEHDVFGCPAAGDPFGYAIANCTHCSVRL